MDERAAYGREYFIFLTVLSYDVQDKVRPITG